MDTSFHKIHVLFSYETRLALKWFANTKRLILQRTALSLFILGQRPQRVYSAVKFRVSEFFEPLVFYPGRDINVELVSCE